MLLFRISAFYFEYIFFQYVRFRRVNLRREIRKSTTCPSSEKHKMISEYADNIESKEFKPGTNTVEILLR